MRLLDHIVVSQTETVSMAARGIIWRVRRSGRLHAEPRASRERAFFDRAQEGGEEGVLVVRMVSENVRWRHPSFSLLRYDLWYDFCKFLFLLSYWRRGRDSNPRKACAFN